MVSFEFTKEFRDALYECVPDVQECTKDKLEFFASCENPLMFAKRLKGMKGVYRLRIGDYRAVFRVERATFIFLIVKNRKDVYQGLSL